MKKLLSLLIVVLALSFIQGGVLSVFAAEKPTTWRFATFTSKKRAVWKEIESYQKEIFEKSKGQLNVVPYPGLSLGITPFDALRALKKGNVEIASVNGAFAGRDEPLYKVLTPQGVWSDPSDIYKWRGPLNKIKAELFGKWGFIPAGDVYVPMDWCYIFTNKLVRSLDDLKGMKIRVGSPDLVKTVNKLGITGQMILTQDLYLSMKTGVIDGCFSSPLVARALSIHEVAKYAAPVFVYTAALPDTGISKIAYNKLPAVSKRALMDVAPTLFQKSFDRFYGSEAIMPYINDLKKGGMIFNPTFSKADRLRFKMAAMEVWEEAARKLGPKGMEYYRILKATLE